jgi:hypothetical protein
MSDFFEGPDPENPDDLGVAPELIEKLTDQISEELRKIGLYTQRLAVVVPKEDEVAMYGLHQSFMSEPPMLVMAALLMGELALERVDTDKTKVSEEILHLEQSLLQDELDEIRKKYGEPDE